MDIINALVKHHLVLRLLYRQSKNNPTLFDELVRHLVIHHTMEEKYLYDLLETIPEARHDSLEAVNEHHIIELIIKDSKGFPLITNISPSKLKDWANTPFIISTRRKMTFSRQLENCYPTMISNFSDGYLKKRKINCWGLCCPMFHRTLSLEALINTGII